MPIELVKEITDALTCLNESRDEIPNVSAFTEYVHKHSWTERWPGEDGRLRNWVVEGEIWTSAIQAAIDKHQAVYLPRRDAPYYIDSPIVLGAGCRLVADPDAEIRLKPGSNCCMVRNEHIADGHAGPVDPDKSADTDLQIVGGIWMTLAVTEQESNGNAHGWALPGGTYHGHGTILLSNVRRFVVRDVTIRQCRPHGIQISNASHFLVEKIYFDRHHRDGVHINGPASFGRVRNIRVVRGVMGDDLVALNAWDWQHTVVSFGAIHHVLVERIRGQAEADPYSQSEIRLLGGTKHFANGLTFACDIHDCVFRDIEGIRTFKMYDQPNLECGVDNDFADPIGNLANLHFQAIRFASDMRDAPFPIASNVDGLSIRDVSLDFEPTDDFTLVQIGPLSMTYKPDPDDPDTWVEVFSPDKDCTVKNLELDNIHTPAGAADPDRLVRIIEQKINLDYPNTIPRGGRGRGILLPAE